MNTQQIRLATALTVVLVLASITGMAVFEASAPSDQSWLLIFILVGLLILPFLSDFSRILTPLGFFALMYLGLPLSAVRQMTLEQHWARGFEINGLTHQTTIQILLADVLAMGILGLVMFYVGYFGIRAKLKPEFFERRFPDSGLDEARLRNIVFFFSLVGMMAYLFFVITQGGVLALLQDPFARSTVSERNTGLAGTYYIVWLVQLWPLASLLWYAFSRRAGFSLGFLLHVSMSIAMLLSLGSRYPVVTYLIMLYLLRIFKKSAKGKPRFSLFSGAAVAIFLIALSLVMVEVRQFGRIDNNWSDRFSGENVFSFLSGQDFVDVEILVLIKNRFPAKTDFLYGETYLSLFAAPIPRQMWPQKPLEPGGLLGSYFFPGEKTGAPPSQIGELYINFGIGGVVLGMLIWGIIFRYLSDYFRPLLSQNQAATFVYFLILTKFIPLIVSGAMTNASMNTLVLLIPTILAFLVCYPKPIQTGWLFKKVEVVERY